MPFSDFALLKIHLSGHQASDSINMNAILCKTIYFRLFYFSLVSEYSFLTNFVSIDRTLKLTTFQILTSHSVVTDGRIHFWLVMTFFAKRSGQDRYKNANEHAESYNLDFLTLPFFCHLQSARKRIATVAPKFRRFLCSHFYPVDERFIPN